MIARRDILIGAGCAVAAGVSLGLKPSRRVSLLGANTLEKVVPRDFGNWTSRDVSDLLAPKTNDSLAARLYSQTVGRVYRDSVSGSEIMMLLAYGDSQTDQLQLHRPEVCYPAFGFALKSNTTATIALAPGGGGTLPVRHIVAAAPDRLENIVYWSRLGEYLPVSGSQQRLDQLKTAMGGYIADGLLARFSNVGDDPASAFATLDAFIPELVHATPRALRRALVGTALAASSSSAERSA